MAAAAFVGLLVAGAMARSAGARPDDLLFVVLGIVPGAVVGGRIGYVLLHPSFFTAVPGRIVDPAVGSLELTLGAVGGALTGAVVGLLLDGRPGRWLHIAAVPLLVAVSIGKLAMVLGGSGQGQPTGGALATAYLGPGPWGSLGPEVPSIPSQAIEGALGLVVLVGVLAALSSPALRRPDGRIFFVALAAWSLVRFGVAATWRDASVVGPFRAEQAIDLAVLIGAVALGLVVAIRSGRTGEPSAERPDSAPGVASP
jgi:phosphatidylglycerol:prolipoprotein diacylglycerol transferase